ncbi:MAG: AAA family ATPase [Planctomycetaceae bacterium]|nr:AAA family ATPase [Planctomycetaceae bacterium]
MAFIPTEAHLRPPEPSQTIDYNQLDSRLAENIEGNLQRWFDGKPIKHAGAWYKIGNKGSLAVNAHDGHWHSHESGEGGQGMLSLYAWQFNLDTKTAAEDLANDTNLITFREARPTIKKQPVQQWEHSTEIPTVTPSDHFEYGKADHVYRYRDTNGNPVGVVMRWDKTEQREKEIRPMSWVQMHDKREPEWKWCGFAEPRPLYKGELIKQKPDAPVVIVEGEKAVEALQPLLPDHIVVTWCGGTGQLGKADFSALQDRKVIIWPDNDEPGHKAAKDICKLLPKARAIDIPKQAPDKWDAADAIAAGMQPDAIKTLLQTADSNLPQIECGMQGMPTSFDKAKAMRPEIIIDGLLYARSKMLVGGAAKAGKSHFVMDLVASLCNGMPFLKWAPARPFRVLYADFELHEWEFRERAGKAFKWCIPDTFGRLSLRKHYDVRSPQEISKVLDRIDASQWDVIVLDCLYKFNQAEDENDNSQMQAICAWMDKIIAQYEITPILIHHFGKGSQAGKSVIDRFRGASSLVGDMDAILSLTPHEEDKNIIVETEVRSFAPTDNFVVRWDYPNFIIDEAKDASKHAKPGAKRKHSDDDILIKLPVGKANAMHFDALGCDMNKRSFEARIAQIIGANVTKKLNANKKLEKAFYRE